MHIKDSTSLDWTPFVKGYRDFLFGISEGDGDRYLLISRLNFDGFFLDFIEE